MGILFEVKKNGATEIRLTEYSIKDFNFTANASEAHNLRHNDIINGVIISGLIDPEIMSNDSNSTNRAREVDSVRRLANWAIIPEFSDCYRDISYKISDARGEVVKEEDFEDCFIVGYEENYSNDTGTGKFKAVIRIIPDETSSAQSILAQRRGNTNVSQRQHQDTPTSTPNQSGGATPRRVERQNINTEQDTNSPSTEPLSVQRLNRGNIVQPIEEQLPTEQTLVRTNTREAVINQPIDTDEKMTIRGHRQPPNGH